MGPAPPTYLAEPMHSDSRVPSSVWPPSAGPPSPVRSKAAKGGEGQWELSPWTQALYPDPGLPTATSQENKT